MNLINTARKYATTAIILLLFSGTPVSATDYALVIGIDTYPSSQWPNLNYAVADAKGMVTFLRDQGFAVTPLYNERATRKRIIAEMEDKLAPKLDKGDRVLIFFAGHGHTRSLGGNDVGYIIPYDGGDSSADYISMDTLLSESRHMGKATHQLFIMDACYSGLLTRSGPLTLDSNDFSDGPTYIKALNERSSRLILTAGGKDQRVRDGGPGGHSFFTYNLLEALQKSLADLNGDGYITFSELTTYLEPKASSWNQTPGYGALAEHGLGSLIFLAQGTTSLPDQTDDSSGGSSGATRAGDQSSLAQIVAQAIKGLGATKAGDFDLQERLAAISTLRLEALNNPPKDYFSQAIDLLVTYIRTNINDRKRLGPGIIRDKRIATYLAEDIIAAMKALQVIRVASGEMFEVRLTAINFDYVNLAPSGGLDLSSFDFTHSSFKNAFLSNCKCYKTDFSFGEFYNTAVWNADFSGVNFHKANLRDAKFANVNFKGSNIEEARDHRFAYFENNKGLTLHQQSIMNK